MEAFIYSPEAYIAHAQRVLSADFPSYCPTPDQRDRLFAAVGACDFGCAQQAPSPACANDTLLLDPALLTAALPSAVGYVTVTLLGAPGGVGAAHSISLPAARRASPTRAGALAPMTSTLTCCVGAKSWPCAAGTALEALEAQLQYFRDAVVVPVHTMRLLCAAEGARVRLCLHSVESVVQAESVLFGFSVGGIGEEMTNDAYMRHFIAPFFLRHRRVVSVSEQFVIKNEDHGELHITVAAIDCIHVGCGIVTDETRVSLMLLPEAPPQMQGRSGGSVGPERRGSAARERSVSLHQSIGAREVHPLLPPPLTPRRRAESLDDAMPRPTVLLPVRRDPSAARGAPRDVSAGGGAVPQYAMRSSRSPLHAPSPKRVGREPHRGAAPLPEYTPQAAPWQCTAAVSGATPLLPAHSGSTRDSKAEGSLCPASAVRESEQHGARPVQASGPHRCESCAAVLPNDVEQTSKLQKGGGFSSGTSSVCHSCPRRTSTGMGLVSSRHSNAESEQDPGERLGYQTPGEFGSTSSVPSFPQKQPVERTNACTQYDRLNEVEKFIGGQTWKKGSLDASTNLMSPQPDHEKKDGGANANANEEKEKEKKGVEEEEEEVVGKEKEKEAATDDFTSFRETQWCRSTQSQDELLGKVVEEEAANVIPNSGERSEKFTWKPTALTSGVYVQRAGLNEPCHSVGVQKTGKPLRSTGIDPLILLPEVPRERSDIFTKVSERESEYLRESIIESDEEGQDREEVGGQDVRVRRSVSVAQLPQDEFLICRRIVQEWTAVKANWEKLPIDPLLQGEPYPIIMRFHHFIALYKELKQRHDDCLAYLDSPYSHTMRGGMVVRIFLPAASDSEAERKGHQYEHVSINRPQRRTKTDVNVPDVIGSDTVSRTPEKATDILNVSVREVQAALGRDILHVFRVGGTWPVLYCTLATPFPADGPAETTLRGQSFAVDALYTTIMEDLCLARDESHCEWLEHSAEWAEAMLSVLRLDVFAKHLQTVRELFLKLAMLLRYPGAVRHRPMYSRRISQGQQGQQSQPTGADGGDDGGERTKGGASTVGHSRCSPTVPFCETGLLAEDQKSFLPVLQELQDTYYLFSELLEPFALQTLHLMDDIAAITDVGQCDQLMNFIQVSQNAQMAEEDAGDARMPLLLAHAEEEKEAFAALIAARKAGAIMPFPNSWWEPKAASTTSKKDAHMARLLLV